MAHEALIAAALLKDESFWTEQWLGNAPVLFSEFLTNGIEIRYSSYMSGPYNDDRSLTADGRRLLAGDPYPCMSLPGGETSAGGPILARVCFSGGPDGQEVVRWESELRHHR